MLIRFNVKNFLSFSTREDGRSEEFSMLAGKVRSKKEHIYDDETIKLLKFAAIFGANAAGKSNLIKAMDFMKSTVISGLPDGHAEKYCKIIPENKDKESYFELELMIDNHYYSYGFEAVLSESKIISEWLIELESENKETVLFTRDIKAGKFQLGGALSGEGLSNKMTVYAEDILEDSSVLLLTVMNKNKRNLYKEFSSASMLQDIYMWIKDSLCIRYPDRPMSHYSYMTNGKKIDDICQVIAAFGTGIRHYKLEEIAVERLYGQLPKHMKRWIMSTIEKKTQEMKQKNSSKEIRFIVRSDKDFYILSVDQEKTITCQTILFSHGDHRVYFRLGEESDGTIRMLDLLEIILGRENKTYVVDELDRCLHPGLTYKFIETYLQTAENKNVQLIVTTHESRLMDFNLLRRDEIWFTNKKKSGETDIYSLEEYNERFDKKVDKAYLEGRYGGVPIFGPIFPTRED